MRVEERKGLKGMAQGTKLIDQESLSPLFLILEVEVVEGGGAGELRWYYEWWGEDREGL